MKGAPVEAAFTPDGTHAYVSNYSMYGQGFGPKAATTARPRTATDSSFLYQISTKTLAIDAVVPVGKVPKYVAVTPDGRYVLATNWCSYDLSVVDTTTEPGGQAHPARPVPARDRDHAGLAHRVHRGDGHPRHRAHRPHQLR